MVESQLNLYNTDQTLDLDNLQVNCLHYYNRHTRNDLEKTEYCLGPIDDDHHTYSDHLFYRKFTFDDLRQLNVTTTELLSWSSTIDLAEKYQYYLHHQDDLILSKEIFFNCTKPWFGPRCQYSFDMGQMYLFQRIVQKIFKRKFFFEPPSNVTCYTHLKCDRGGSGMCLDWREVCDGRIDCVDGGADEAECFDLEVNECDENEYRCHNGLCIAKHFLEDEIPQCLDQSDILGVFSLPMLSQLPYIFDYEEQSCPPGSAQFSCGNGECVADFDECKNNKRHLLLIESISAQGNLSDTCWMIMICLTKIQDRINEISCDQFLGSPNISTYAQTCDEIIQFPTVPVLFGHVRFLYRLENHRDLDINLTLMPDYICYDQQLCDFLTPTYLLGTYSCRQSNEFDFDWSMKPNSWTSLIRLVERYFRKCLTRYNTHQNYSHSSSLYCCKNSSKCISKHRILDNISDCHLNDDEEQSEVSCSIDDVLRFKCINDSKCYSSLVSREICPSSHLRNLDEIEFREICDRHNEMFPVVIDGRTHTDETDCEDWPCSNFYTRCDGFWSCSDGKDEENCTKQICPLHFLPCVFPSNYTFTCLPANQIGDEHIDCLGAVDELQHCRSANHLDLFYVGFRCWNSDICASPSNLCNENALCPFGADVAFCEDQREICSSVTDNNRIDVQNAICLTEDVRRIQFSIETSPVYPPSGNRTIERISERQIERRNVQNLNISELADPAWL